MIAKCPECHTTSPLSDELAGKRVRCPQCGAIFSANQPKKWYHAAGDNKLGPIDQEQFDRLVGDGTIAPETLVWCKGMAGWQPLAALGPAIAAGGRASLTPGLRYGSLVGRFTAKIIDLIFMLALAGMVEGLSRKLFPGAYTTDMLTPVFTATLTINILLGIFYVTWFVGKFGATPGKMVVKLKISNPAGGKIGYGHAFGRYCGEYIAAFGVMGGLALLSFWLSSRLFPFHPILGSVAGAIFATFILIYAPAFFDPQRRTLYDRLCNTRVLAA